MALGRTGGNITTGFAVLAGGHACFGFENIGEIMLIGKTQMIGYGFDGVGGVLQQHFRKTDFSVHKIRMGRSVVVFFELLNHLGAGNKQTGTDFINGH